MLLVSRGQNCVAGGLELVSAIACLVGGRTHSELCWWLHVASKSTPGAATKSTEAKRADENDCKAGRTDTQPEENHLDDSLRTGRGG